MIRRTPEERAAWRADLTNLKTEIEKNAQSVRESLAVLRAATSIPEAVRVDLIAQKVALLHVIKRNLDSTEQLLRLIDDPSAPMIPPSNARGGTA